MLALIGGSGLYGLDGSDRLVAEGPVSLGQSRYGEPSAPVFRYRAESGEILFLPRHGIDHSIAPHLIDYRANIDALLRAGASRIVGVCSVGAIETGIEPGSLVLPDQLIDYTWGRDQTFHLPALCPVGNLAAGNGPGPIEFETVRKQAAVRSRTVIDIALGLLPG
jgi:5'-methylthioinosine phosphorylase